MPTLRNKKISNIRAHIEDRKTIEKNQLLAFISKTDKPLTRLIKEKQDPDQQNHK